MSKPKQKFIVAEVSKNWRRGEMLMPETGTLAQLFEHVIEVNDKRGYRLHSFSLHQCYTPHEEMNETIIAVFQDREQP